MANKNNNSGGVGGMRGRMFFFSEKPFLVSAMSLDE